MNYIKNTLENNYLAHHGVLGQKWGVRRYQNADGSLTNAGKKHYYKESLRADKKRRKELESKVYDSSKFADAYYKKGNYYAKKYAKAVAKDPTESDPKTQRLRNTLTTLAADAEYWDHYNHEQMGKLGDQIQNMVNKYSDTKIKDVNTNTTKYGTRYIKNALAPIRDLTGTNYKMFKYYDPNDNTDYYRPGKLLTNEYGYE